MNTITKANLAGIVARMLPVSAADDLPMIRQAINDTADGYRKDGYRVGGFEQDSTVRAVQKRLKARETGMRMGADRL